MNKKKKPTAPFVRSMETDTLAQMLLQLEIKETLTYAEMSDAIGIAVTGSSHHLRSARGIAEREGNMLFEPVPGHGIQRMEPSDAPKIGAAARKRFRRKAKRCRRRMGFIPYTEMSPKTRHEVAIEQTVMGIVEASSSPKTVKRLEEEVEEDRAVPWLKAVAALASKS